MDVGVIGTGVMGKNHVRVYSEMKEVGDLFLYDVNSSASSGIAKGCGINVVDSVDELLKNVDAVSICVSTQYHYETAVQVARAGISMLIEKPICQTSKQGEELLSEIPDDIVAGVGHIERFNPIVNEISRIIDSPLYVEMKRHNPSSIRINGSSVVEDLMIHDIDIIFNNGHFRGPYNLYSSGNSDICGAIFEFPGFPVYLSTSRKSSKKIRMVYIEEENFTIEGDYMTQEVYIHKKPERYSHDADKYIQENIVEKVMVSKVEPLKVELNTFVDCVRSGKEFPVSPDQAVKNVRICEDIRQKCGY
ncbi:Gfo/Idh/MocA family protein [Methanoplanus limicola]|uniref:Oxidoreductase domain protein n=1 Tax=Methanoplanus limicola DSM 2279 TaxID=937775 RepID=H1YZQ7_9EURY|nr:Gfo/Idh/MocA family oxidoreductase [Methanoplanus limicola]EHQ34319.1 oxidoreductase domain protein [Methanoplanus limicola DSM 2279]